MARKNQKERQQPGDDDAPGWHAIDSACAALYPGQDNPPHYIAPLLPQLGGDGHINGISAFRADDPPHWHLVTYGFSELYAKEWDDPDVSGWGFELTMRLPRAESETQPSAYAINFLFNLGRYVRSSRNPLGSGHAMDLNGPICVGSDTALHGAAFVTDPQLGEIDTPNGSVEFVQVVGVTSDEHAAFGEWQGPQVMDLIRAVNPLLITDLARRSVFDDPEARRQLEEGIDRDGSQSDRVFVSVVDWSANTDSANATLGAKGVLSLLPKLRSRLMHQRHFMLIGREKLIVLEPAEEATWRAEEAALVLQMTPAAVDAMRATLKPVRGTYTWPELPGFTLTVVPSEITDSEGKLIEVIG